MQVCGKHALHPDIPEDAEAHTKACKAREERLNKQPAAAELECAICLEKVLSKENASERKFGLLSCEHPFCLPCIRDWRRQVASAAVLDTVSTLYIVCMYLDARHCEHVGGQCKYVVGRWTL
jgi:E3 ubiquitin-protein ligase makorin